MTRLYTGPVIDPHHHLWNLEMQRHPWLLHTPGQEAASGNGMGIRRNYMPDDYLADVQGQNIVSSIHVEAGWDHRFLTEETVWLDSLDKSHNVARHYIARVPLEHPDAARLLAEANRNSRVVGIRDIVSWHPDPAKSFVAREGLMSSSQWRAGLTALARHDLVFDLMLFPWQTAEAEHLLHDFPDTMFVLNHCGSPADRTPEGILLWRDGLRRLGKAENLRIKISNPVAYDPHWSIDSLKDVIEHCIACFGVERSMFASDFPVAGLYASFPELYGAFRNIVAEYSPSEQSALFFQTANQTYRLALDRTGLNQE